MNGITGLEFYHFVMQTYAATYDVVVGADEDMDLNNIKIIGGNFWPCVIL
jgi:hypothetical protein